jgi:hypothetical protein
MTASLFVEILELTDLNLHARSFYISSSFCQRTAILGKTPSVKNEHLRVAGHCRKQKKKS